MTLDLVVRFEGWERIVVLRAQKDVHLSPSTCAPWGDGVGGWDLANTLNHSEFDSRSVLRSFGSTEARPADSVPT